MWPNTVQTLFDYDNVEAQVRSKVVDIAVTEGLNDHGTVMLTDQTICLHWRAGSYRIFGEMVGSNFHFMGYGMHTGTGNNKYTVELETSKTSKAMTS